MLTKAILTGVVLSAITGSIVYFGTEGADAKIIETSETAFAQGTELAGAPDEVALEKVVAEKVEVAVIEDVAVEMTENRVAFQNSDPQESKPKTKWLDQYLKRIKPEAKPAEEDKVEVDADVDVEAEVEMEAPSEVEVDVETSVDGKKRRKHMRIKKRKDRKAKIEDLSDHAMVKDESASESLDIDALDLDAVVSGEDVDVEMLKKQMGLDGKENVEIRVLKKVMKGSNKTKPHMTPQPLTIDYDMVLGEAKKLIVTDMRNQAVLEIIDYAIDNRDMSEASDLVEELSTPELRDTARARIGAGLARCGKPEAAFAVIDELEIDELAAPIRLEIITALMATQKERRIAGIRR